MSPKQFIIVIIQFYDYVYLTAIRKKDKFFVIACVLYMLQRNARILIYFAD